MSIADLELTVKVLRDCYDSLSNEQVRLKETNVFLEQRIRKLEQSLSLPSPAQDRTVVPVKTADGEGVGRELEDAEAADADAAEDDLVEHSLGETIWDAVVFVGLPELSRGGSAILLVSMLLNAAVQVYICTVLFTSDDFMQRRRFRELAEPMKEFRFNMAHDHRQVDAKGRSLASRICEDDPSLALGFRQADILVEINHYLGLGLAELEQTGLGTGPMLCAVCIFLFAAAILRELRSVVESTWAVSAVPRGRTTALRDGHLATISCGRFVCILVNNMIRVGIAIMLLITGITWLAATSSITDLILNAAALCFILDMDECLFETTVPSSVRLRVCRVEPLKYRRSYWNSEAIAPLLGLCAVIVLSISVLVSPNTADMIKAKRMLCDGQKDFIVRQNAAGFMVATNTTDIHAETPPSLMENAVEELVLSKQLSGVVHQLNYWTDKKVTYNDVGTYDIPALAGMYTCQDQDVAFGGYMQTAFPTYFTNARFAIGKHAGMTLLQRPFACADYTAFCQTVAILRVLCPITCGCHDPSSGLLRLDPKFGCPSTCKPLRDQVIASRPCTDLAVVNSSSWRSYWTTFRAVFIADNPDPVLIGLITDWTHRKISQGCANAELAPMVNLSDCVSQGFASVAPMCPSRCCQGPNVDPSCPTSCSASAGGGSR